MNLAGAGLLALMAAAAAQMAPPAASEVAAGRVLFEGSGRCLTCHTVDERGTGSARDLSWIGVLRSPESLRDGITSPRVHADVPPLSAAEVSQLVAYLRTLRKMWKIEGPAAERDIAPTTENVPFFNRPERDAEERPDELLDALHIRPGAAVADIGSGTGYYTWRLAQRVGPTGKVYAVDVQRQMLDLTKSAVEARKVDNVEYVLATDTSLGLPHASIDLAFIAYAYHEFSDPPAMMGAIRRALRPGGRVFILEYAKESNIAPASPLHRMSFEELRREIEPLGFVIDQLLDFLPVQHGVVFTIK